MAYFCQACGKELDHEEELCEECKKEMSILDNAPATQSAPARPTAAPVAPPMNDAKKGFGPAIAALILAIIGFLTTAVTALVLNACIEMPEFWSAFNEAMNSTLGGSEFPPEILEFSIKFAFAMYYYDGGLFMLIGAICALVGLVKYCKNTTPNKAKSVLVLVIIAAVLIFLSFVIATSGYFNVSKMLSHMYGF